MEPALYNRIFCAFVTSYDFDKPALLRSHTSTFAVFVQARIQIIPSGGGRVRVLLTTIFATNIQRAVLTFLIKTKLLEGICTSIPNSWADM